MPSAGAQGSRRARMPRHRQLGHHATVLDACRKGAIGIASPHVVTTARPSRFTADAISITPFISQTQQANSPATSLRPQSLPHGDAPREVRRQTDGTLRLGLLGVDKPVAERDQNRAAHDVAQRGGGQVKRNARGVERVGAGDVGTVAACMHHGAHR